MRSPMAWLPALLLGSGALFALGIRDPRAMALRTSLDVLPDTLASHGAMALALSPQELAANGASDYLLRAYVDSAGSERLGLYVGYYARQSQGHTIHSPRNCLPGGGWEPVSHRVAMVPVGTSTVPVNRYVIAREGQQAVVYYWYQGRRRVAADEYRVKWDLLRDAALEQRTEEALVRLVLPLTATQDEGQADALARHAIGVLVPALYGALPS